MLDHAAKPPIADGGSAEWSDRIAALAACGNVWCKVSGLATEAKWTDWDAERLFPFVQHVANCFGEDRLIFGSDWPVCLLAGSYGEIKSALEACLAKLGPQRAREGVWGECEAGVSVGYWKVMGAKLAPMPRAVVPAAPGRQMED